MSKSFLQSIEWLEFQKSVGNKAWRYEQNGITANVIRLGLPLGKSYLYIPHGPEIDLAGMQGGLKNSVQQFVGYLKELARSEKSIFVKVEPQADAIPEILVPFGFKRSNRQVQPHKSVVVDLNQSEEELLGKFHHKTRYNIRVAEKHGITIKPSHDVEQFWKLLKKTTKRDRFSSHNKEYYKKLLAVTGDISADLIVAYHQEKPVAAAIVLGYGETSYYLHGASDYEARQLMAPHALHWDIIKFLKNHGIKYYDFWGIDHRRWPGVTRFKLGFDGRQVEYPGTFDMTVSWFWHLLYKISRKIF